MMGWQRVAIELGTTHWLELEVVGVHRGDAYDDVALTESGFLWSGYHG